MDIVHQADSERLKMKSYANVAPLPFTDRERGIANDHVTTLSDTKGSKGSEVAQVDSLNETQSKLEIQREVNKELKRLLVASVGEELQSRFDQLVTERASLSFELDKSVQRLSEGNEELECMSIQCDMWRSKFIASRLMIDELVNEKATVTVEHRECQKVINKLLEEHSQLYQQLSTTNTHLKQLATMATSKKLSERPHVLVRPIQMPTEDHDLLELAEENCHVSSDLVRSSDSIPTTCNSVSRSLTTGEQLANQLLHTREDKVQRQLVNTMMSSSLSSTIRAFLSSRQDHTDIKFKCCRCKGQVFVV